MAAVTPYIVGVPGIRTPLQAIAYVVFKQVEFMSGLALGKFIDGTKASDPDNVGDVDRLRPGLVMGKIAASGLYANSIIGVTAASYTSGATSLTVTPQCATEIVRRIGATGTFKLTAPPAAAGTVATTVVTYSAVNTSTGVITVTNIGVNNISGGFIQPTDGSETPISMIPNGFAIPVSDSSGRTTVEWNNVPFSGSVISANIINWPTDTSLQTWLTGQLNAVGQYVFDSAY